MEFYGDIFLLLAHSFSSSSTLASLIVGGIMEKRRKLSAEIRYIFEQSVHSLHSRNVGSEMQNYIYNHSFRFYLVSFLF